MGDALAIGAAVSIIQNCRRDSANIERTAKNLERCPVGISIERKHFLIERHGLWRRLIDLARDRIRSPKRQLLQGVVLECGSWNGGCSNDRGCDANPLAVEEEKQIVMENRTAQASAKMVYCGARLMISRGGVREIVGSVEARAVPQFI